MRRFEGHGRYWAIEQDGNTLITENGRIGKQGRKRTKRFRDERTAEREHDHAVELMRSQGYEEVDKEIVDEWQLTAGQQRVLSSDDSKDWLKLANSLFPRHASIVRSHVAGEEPERMIFNELNHELVREWAKPKTVDYNDMFVTMRFDPEFHRGGEAIVRIRWRFGHVDGARIEHLEAIGFTDFLDHPCSALIRELRLSGLETMSDALKILATRERLSLRILVVDAKGASIPDSVIAEVRKACPNLAELEVL